MRLYKFEMRGFPIGVSLSPFQFSTYCFFESLRKGRGAQCEAHNARPSRETASARARVYFFIQRTHFIRAVHIKAVPSLSLPSMARDSIGSPYKQQPLSSRPWRLSSISRCCCLARLAPATNPVFSFSSSSSSVFDFALVDDDPSGVVSSSRNRKRRERLLRHRLVAMRH